LVELGIDREHASELGVATISLLEGAEMIARVTRTREPLEVAARTLGGLV
jgi:hypothetical protein